MHPLPGVGAYRMGAVNGGSVGHCGAYEELP